MQAATIINSVINAVVRTQTVIFIKPVSEAVRRMRNSRCMGDYFRLATYVSGERTGYLLKGWVDLIA